ncbi:MAG: GTPase HflX [Polyangiales bacterium]
MRTLERIYRRRVPLSQITTRELTQSLLDGSRETGRQVGALVHRSGSVDFVIVGDAGKLELPDIGRLRAAQGRFRGLRLIHTHLRNEPLTRDDLVDLVRLRLDLVCAILLRGDGDAGQIHYAHNVPSSGPLATADGRAYREIGPVRADRLDVDFGALVADLESEFQRLARTREVVAKDGRAILIHVAEKSKARDADVATSLRELQELARTAGVEVVDVVIQQRDKIDPKFVLGRGKLDDVVIRAMQLDAQTLIFDRELSPTQAAAIASVMDLKVIDRTQLILDIFAQRAESKDGKLQVELAQLKYALPRLGLKDDALSRLTGGIGGRGPGETKLEIGRRRARERVHHLEQHVKALARQRQQRRRSRGRGDVPVVAIVGYTNAGKSTLMNALTGSTVFAEDKLFATLDTRARRLFLPTTDPAPEARAGREIVLVDTVGFIRDLPEDLFAAFRATFEEAADADLLLHLVDASDPAHAAHIATTEALLEELGLHERPRLLIYNKSDLLVGGEGERKVVGRRKAFLTSAIDARGHAAIVTAIDVSLREIDEERRLSSADEIFAIDGVTIANGRASYGA